MTTLTLRTDAKGASGAIGDRARHACKQLIIARLIAIQWRRTVPKPLLALFSGVQRIPVFIQVSQAAQVVKVDVVGARQHVPCRVGALGARSRRWRC